MSAPTPLRRNRRYAALFAADLISGLGDRIHMIALFLLVYEWTGRALDLGMLAIVQLLPATLIAPVSGWVLDRVDRRRMMLYMDLLRMGLVLLVPFVDSLPELMVVAACLAVARQFHAPARLAILPSIVAKDQLVQANAMGMGAEQLMLVVGPAIGGAIVAAFGTDMAFRLDAVSYVLAATCVLLIGNLGGAKPRGVQLGRHAWREFRQEVREGASTMLGDPVLRFALAFFAAITAVSALQQPVVVIFVQDTLGRGPEGLGFVLSAAGLGGLVGSVLASLTRRFPALETIALCAAAGGAVLVGFALSRELLPAIVAFAGAALLGGVVQVRAVSLFQERIPEDSRGRAFGWLGPIFGPLTVASIGLGTLLADRVGVVPVLAASGILQLLLGASALGRLRLARPASLDQELAPPEGLEGS